MTPVQLRDRRREREQQHLWKQQIEETLKAQQQHYAFVDSVYADEAQFKAQQRDIQLAVERLTRALIF